MPGVLKQINRSKGGLPKLPVEQPVILDAAGIDGDWQFNRKYHGGPDRAVLMIACEVVDELKAAGFPVFYGALGENLSVAGLDPALWRAGQRYRVGDAAIELTTLRQPCASLFVYSEVIGRELYDRRCGKGDFTSKRWARGGFYARVVREGLVTEGATVALESDIA